MNVGNLAALPQKSVAATHHNGNSGFKALMDQKISQVRERPETSMQPMHSHVIKETLQSMMKHHDMSKRSIETLMTHKKSFSPQQLLRVQYSTALWSLREQMYCRVGEFSANTFKSLTQMPV